MDARMRTFMPAGFALALFVALALAISSPQEALAKVNPWGAGTSYNAKTSTLTVKSGKHTIKSLNKKYKGKLYSIRNLVVKGGTTKLNAKYCYLESLKVNKGKLISKDSISVSGSMRVSGGTVSVSSSERYGSGLRVSEDLTVTGGKVIANTSKEGCTAISVSGDMKLNRGTVKAIAKGKSASGLRVSGYLSVCGGNLKSTTSGKYGMAIQVFGDLIMIKGSIDATSGRGKAVQCFDLLKVTGGKVSAKSVSGEMALDSGEVAVVSSSCLGAIRGQLPEGAQFSTGGVTYSVTDRYSKVVEVVGGSTAAQSVAFGGVTYGIGSRLTSASIA